MKKIILAILLILTIFILHSIAFTQQKIEITEDLEKELTSEDGTISFEDDQNIREKLDDIQEKSIQNLKIKVNTLEEKIGLKGGGEHFTLLRETFPDIILIEIKKDPDFGSIDYYYSREANLTFKINVTNDIITGIKEGLDTPKSLLPEDF